MRTVYSAIALLVIAVLGMAVNPTVPAPAHAASFGVRGYAVYYNDMKDLTTVYFRQTTAETSYKGSNNWLIRNPNASGGANIVLVTMPAAGVAVYGNTGLTIPPLATFSGNDYRNSVTLYCASSTPVELWFETEE